MLLEHTFQLQSLHIKEWRVEGIPKATVYLCHGMTESSEAYQTLAKMLTKKDMLVVADDHVGHGRTATCADRVVYCKGPEEFLQGTSDVIEYYREKYPALPVYVIGFSLGSYILRVLLHRGLLEKWEVKKIVLIGTEQYQPGTRLISKLFGILPEKLHNGFVQTVAFSANKKVKQRRTDYYDWLCSREKIIDGYLANPDNRILVSAGMVHALMELITMANDYHSLPQGHDQEILFQYGEEDPASSEEGNRKLSYTYQSYGYLCQVKGYRGRHIVLADVDWKRAMGDIQTFLCEKPS